MQRIILNYNIKFNVVLFWPRSFIFNSTKLKRKHFVNSYILYLPTRADLSDCSICSSVKRKSFCLSGKTYYTEKITRHLRLSSWECECSSVPNMRISLYLRSAAATHFIRRGLPTRDRWERRGSARTVTMMGVRFSQATKNPSLEERRNSFSTLKLVGILDGVGVETLRFVGNVLRRNAACIQGRSFIYFQILSPIILFLSYSPLSLFPSASVPRRNPIERPIFVKSDSPDDGEPEYRTRTRSLLFFKTRYSIRAYIACIIA